MKFRYLGTAASEGWPALFCNCEYCLKAKKLGGKNLRTRSQAIVNDDMLIDFPGDTFAHMLATGMDFSKVRWCLVRILTATISCRSTFAFMQKDVMHTI